MQDFAAELAALDAQYEAAQASGGRHPVYRGVGVVEVARVERSDLEGSTDLNAVIHFKTEKGMAFFRTKLNNHQSETTMSMTKGALSNLGHVGPLSSVPAWIVTLMGASVEIDVKHTDKLDVTTGETKEYTNVYIRKVVAPPAQQGFGAFPVAGDPNPAATNQFFAQAAQPLQAQAVQNMNAEFPAPVQQGSPAPFAAAPAEVQQVAQTFDATPVQAAAPLPFATQ